MKSVIVLISLLLPQVLLASSYNLLQKDAELSYEINHTIFKSEQHVVGFSTVESESTLSGKVEVEELETLSGLEGHILWGKPILISGDNKIDKRMVKMMKGSVVIRLVPGTTQKISDTEFTNEIKLQINNITGTEQTRFNLVEVEGDRYLELTGSIDINRRHYRVVLEKDTLDGKIEDNLRLNYKLYFEKED